MGSSPTGANLDYISPLNRLMPFPLRPLRTSLPAPPMLRMLFNPLILRPGVPPLAEGGNDFSAAASAELFLPAFYSMSVCCCWKVSVG